MKLVDLCPVYPTPQFDDALKRGPIVTVDEALELSKPSLTPEQDAWCKKYVRKYKDYSKNFIHSHVIGHIDFSSLGSSADGLTIMGDCDEIPLKIANCYPKFKLDETKVKNLKGCPDSVHDDCIIIDNNQMTSFEGAPKYIAWTLEIHAKNLTSLKDIHKHFKNIEKIRIANNVKSHILGLIFIEGLKKVEVINRFAGFNVLKVEEAVEIVMNHHGEGRAGVIAATEELMEADLDDYAQL